MYVFKSDGGMPSSAVAASVCATVTVIVAFLRRRIAAHVQVCSLELNRLASPVTNEVMCGFFDDWFCLFNVV